VTGVFAVALGLAFPLGGLAEASATVLFGVWFLVCLLLAFRAIRADDIVQHRRWMIRAFGISVAVGTIRIWIRCSRSAGYLPSPRLSVRRSGFPSHFTLWLPSSGSGLTRCRGK
jgi:Predicted membrane protein (DUF2306)